MSASLAAGFASLCTIMTPVQSFVLFYYQRKSIDDILEFFTTSQRWSESSKLIALVCCVLALLGKTTKYDAIDNHHEQLQQNSCLYCIPPSYCWIRKSIRGCRSFSLNILQQANIGTIMDWQAWRRKYSRAETTQDGGWIIVG